MVLAPMAAPMLGCVAGRIRNDLPLVAGLLASRSAHLQES
jgi:hypothetical protein